MKKLVKGLVLGIFVFTATVACSLIESITSRFLPDDFISTESPFLVTAESSGSDDFGYQVLLEDDFSTTMSGWEILSNEYGSTGYDQNGYVVASTVKDEYFWGLAGMNFDNTQIEVDAAVLETVLDGNDTYGLDCRMQENGDGYGFRISSDGYVAISKYVDSEGSILVDWTENSAVFTDGSVNHLTAVCDGSTLSFTVNGYLVAETEDYTFSSGDIALSVAGLEEGTVRVLFDNVVVYDLN